MRTFENLRQRAGLVALCLALLPLSAAAAKGEGVGDLLDSPAPSSVRAANGVLLAVTRAEGRLVAVGERGTVLLSDDAGKSWRQAKSVPVSVALTGVAFVSGQLGWAIGHSGVVLHTADGGETWTRQLDGRAIGSLAQEEARTRAAAGEVASRAQRDANNLAADGPDKPLLGIHFADDSHGWVVGAYGLALATTDGGQSWKSIMGHIPNSGGRHLYTIVPVAGGMVIAGEQGSLFRSADRGETFSAIKTPYAGTFFGVLEAGQGQLIAYGLRGNAWRSSADGAWARVDLGQAATLTGGATLADGHLLLADEGGRLFHGAADGSSFTVLKQVPLPGLTGLVQTADGALVLAGQRGARRVELLFPAVELPR
jgi:photosystem II stability/assembly factor-like uncharacterized protein